MEPLIALNTCSTKRSSRCLPALDLPSLERCDKRSVAALLLDSAEHFQHKVQRQVVLEEVLVDQHQKD